MMVFLSHILAESIPVYGHIAANIERRQLKSTDRGDSCQTYWIGFENHWGTHVDCPAHFFSEGKRVNDYPCEYWHYLNPQIIELTPEPSELITIPALEGQISPQTDLILLKTGWESRRGTDQYSLNNPGVHPEVGLWMRHEYPNIRCIGMDTVSISSYQWRDEGRKAHRVFLDPSGEGGPILIIEDMCFAEVAEPDELNKVIVMPLMVEGIDSAPCTIVGYFNR